jgi:hypothetical protein
VAGLDVRRPSLSLNVVPVEIRRADEIVPAFPAIKDRAEALYVCGDALITNNRIRIITLALGARLATMYPSREHVDAGGLMSYGPTFPTCTGVPQTMSTRFCAGRSRPTFQSSSLPSLISS